MSRSSACQVSLWVFLAAPALASAEVEGPAGPLSAADVVGRFGSSVVLVEARLSDGETRFGSGFFVGPPGVVATSLHLLDGAVSVVVRLEGERFEMASLRAFDIARDLALFEISDESFVPLLAGETSELHRGDVLYVISNPMGLVGTISEGLLGAWREPEPETSDDSIGGIRLGPLGEGRLLQISAPVSPGSSGAPVFDERGRVVGVVAAGLGGGALDLNFAVPIEALVRLFEVDEGWHLGSLQGTLDRRRRDLAEPHLVDARFHLADGNVEEASKALDRALAAHPRSGEGLTLKGRVLLEAGRIDEAGELFRGAVEANPESAEAWENLGRYFLEHGPGESSPEAAAAFEKALDLEPWRAEAALGLGVALVGMGRLREGRATLERAVEADRDHVRAWVALGTVCLVLEDTRAAQEAFESAIWADRDDPAANCALATVYSAVGDQRAGEYRRRCAELAEGSP